MLKNPKISIIIPAFNAENHIKQAITSALMQSYKNIEVIVVDDGSTDNTVKVVSSFTDKRLKLLENKQNRGVSYSRNRAIKEASGNWVALLDADDWYAPDRLEKLVPMTFSENADLLADNFYFVREHESSPWSTFLLENGKTFETIQQISPTDFIKSEDPSGKSFSFGFTKPLIKREFLLDHGIQYDENLQLGEDFSLYLDCLLHEAHFFFTPEPYYYYHNREFSLTNVTNLKYLTVYEGILTKFLQNKIVEQNAEYQQTMNKLLKAFRKQISYYVVVDHIKKRHFWDASIQSFQHPYFFIRLSQKLPGILSRFLQFYILHKESAYEQFYSRTKLDNNAELQYNK